LSGLKTTKTLVDETLTAICQDKDAPAAAKAQAARTLAEIHGLLGRHAEPPKDDERPSEMTSTQVDDEIRRLRDKITRSKG
jgi:hypothetical protein